MLMSVDDMLREYSNDSAHPREVRRLSMMIFDEVCETILELPNKHRNYLEAAALLHDIGYAVNSKSHNKESQKLILDNGLKEFNTTETKIISCIARYHRGSLPDKREHDFYNTLDKQERKIVKRLAGILRIADGLDRAHLSLIKKIKINYNEDDALVEFILTPNTYEYHPDISYAARKRDLFEIAFKAQSFLRFEK